MPRSLFTTVLPPLLSREQAKALADRVLAFAKADETRVNVSSDWSGNTRFAGGEITTSGGVTDTTVTVISTIGKRRASATTNILDDASLKRTVDLAERLAKLAPEDPEIMPELGTQSYVTVDGFLERTANLDAEARALAVRRVIERAGEEGKAVGDAFVAGYLEANAQSRAIATSRGLFAYHRSTDANLGTTVRTPDGTGSGWASGGARDWQKLDPAALGTAAARKAVASRNPQAIEPGMYTVVLEPQAVADLIPQLGGSFNARSADEGRGTFSKRGGGTKLGEKIADERVTIYSDPADPDLLTQPFDAEGLPLQRRVWIENGVLKNLSYSRYWAQKQGKDATPGPGNLIMEGGSATMDDLIKGVERGVLVTRFWYIRSLDPQTLLLTGLTRDGLFLIEKGKVTRPVKNMRWNESPVFALNNLDAMTPAERTVSGEGVGGVGFSIVCPAARIREFTFTSGSDAV